MNQSAVGLMVTTATAFDCSELLQKVIAIHQKARFSAKFSAMPVFAKMLLQQPTIAGMGAVICSNKQKGAFCLTNTSGKAKS